MHVSPDAASSDPSPTPLLLLPGTLCDARVFAPLRDRLPGRGAVVAAMAGSADRHALARQILAAAPPRFALLGFSLGAILAVEIASLAPGRVYGLAIVAGNLAPVPAHDHAVRRAAVAAADGGMARFVRDMLWPTYVAPGAANDAALRDLTIAMAGSLPAATFAMQTELALGRPDLRPRLAALAMPALVLGGAQDAIAPPARQREAAALLPDARLAIVPDAGHFVLLERPDVVATHVAAWLDRTDAAASAANTFIEEPV